MKIAAHFLINEHGKIFKGAVLNVACNKLIGITEMGNQIQELAQMAFYSGVIIPSFPDLSIHWNTLEIQKKSPEAPYWLKTMPSCYHRHVYTAWISNLQASDAHFNLAQAVNIFCVALPKLLKLEESAFLPDYPVEAWLVSGIDYHSFRIKKESKFRKLI
ncbi:MAG: hypothetical protein ACK5MI_06400 [Mangrovibacterium sp.]